MNKILKDSRENLLLIAVLVLVLVTFVIPLPGDRGMLLNHYWPVVSTGITPVTEVDVKEPPITPIEQLDQRQLYVSAIREIYRQEFPQELMDWVYEQSHQYGVQPDLVVGLIAAESSFSPSAVSRVGAIGYTQVWPKWHLDRIGGRNINNPYINIQVGVDYLAECIKRRVTMYDALACYNGSDSKESADRYYMRVHGRLHELQVTSLMLAGI